MFRKCCAVLFLVGGFSLTAQAQFTVEQGKVTLSVKAGDRVNDFITIHNGTDQEQGVKVYWEDFDYTSPYDGSKKFLPSGTMPGSAGSWVSFHPQEFRIAAKSKQRIEYTINVPEDIAGGHYGVLFFEKASRDKLAGNTGISVVMRVGSLFFIEAHNSTRKASIDNIQPGGRGLTGDFMNQGNVILIPKVSYYVMDSDGMVADRGDANKIYVPAGKSAAIDVPLLKDLKAGTFNVVLNADLGDGDVVVREIDVTKDAAGQLAVVAVRE